MNLKAAPDGFISLPIYTYIDNKRWDNNGPLFDTCNYAVTSEQQRLDNDTVFANYTDIRNDLTPAFVEEKFLNDFGNETLNATYFNSLNYHHFERYGDRAFAEIWNRVN